MATHQGRIRVLGIAGGTGSGKSEAARRFEELGFPVINADAIGHDLIRPGGDAEALVVEAFGRGILSEGQIDRVKLGARVFADPDARKRLNEIVHPLIKQEIKLKIKALAAEGCKTVLIDAALIAESGEKEPCLDGFILVTSPEEIRAQRLVKNRGLSHKEAMARIRSQRPPEKKLALADWVLDNDGSVEDLRRGVDALALELRAYEH